MYTCKKIIAHVYNNVFSMVAILIFTLYLQYCKFNLYIKLAIMALHFFKIYNFHCKFNIYLILTKVIKADAYASLIIGLYLQLEIASIIL